MEICETSGLPIPMVPCLHRSNSYIKRKLWAWRVQKCIALVGADTVLITAWPQSTLFHGGSIRHRMEICETSALPIPMVPRVHQRNSYIKRKLRAWRVQKCIAQVGADTLLTTVWKQIPRFMGGSIGPRMEICETSALTIPMVLRLYQSNGYIKRKLRAWRVQNCIAVFGSDTVLTTA